MDDFIREFLRTLQIIGDYPAQSCSSVWEGHLFCLVSLFSEILSQHLYLGGFSSSVEPLKYYQ